MTQHTITLPHGRVLLIDRIKLDMRHKWEVFDNEICYPQWYSQHCSGCTETKENQLSPDRGSGCSECGYTGRSRRVVYVPLMIGTVPLKLPSGNWQLLGIAPLTEEQAAEVVLVRDSFIGKTYWCYGTEDYTLFSAIESFHSLLTANGVDVSKRWAVLFENKN